ncbi:hypothetical protein AgCh_028108 [Apium graveolens]
MPFGKKHAYMHAFGESRDSRVKILYVIPTYPFMGPISAFPPTTLIPFTYNVPNGEPTSEAGQMGGEQSPVRQQDQQQQQPGQQRHVVAAFSSSIYYHNGYNDTRDHIWCSGGGRGRDGNHGRGRGYGHGSGVYGRGSQVQKHPSFKFNKSNAN